MHGSCASSPALSSTPQVCTQGRPYLHGCWLDTPPHRSMGAGDEAHTSPVPSSVFVQDKLESMAGWGWWGRAAYTTTVGSVGSVSSRTPSEAVRVRVGLILRFKSRFQIKTGKPVGQSFGWVGWRFSVPLFSNCDFRDCS